ncbi:hypothetical protein GOODEAATRI_018128 [Goodea atripinnis]|uniref:Uncharacterized protein n=1 Tax=Goodea atripinnis TaxID=208336 RepID=A0ABV0PF14_9TELE
MIQLMSHDYKSRLILVGPRITTKLADFEPLLILNSITQETSSTSGISSQAFSRRSSSALSGRSCFYSFGSWVCKESHLGNKSLFGEISACCCLFGHSQSSLHFRV